MANDALLLPLQAPRGVASPAIVNLPEVPEPAFDWTLHESAVQQSLLAQA